MRNSVSAGPPDFIFQFGLIGAIPVTGDWNADGITGIGVVDPATETWYLRNSLSAGAPQITPYAFGFPGSAAISGQDVPEPALGFAIVLLALLPLHQRSEAR